MSFLQLRVRYDRIHLPDWREHWDLCRRDSFAESQGHTQPPTYLQLVAAVMSVP